MSIESEIARINSAKRDIRLAIENKGVSVPTDEKIDTYDEYVMQIETEKIYQEKTVTPSAIGESVIADTGYDALSKVNVTGDMNLSSENIKKDVSIFGVTGTYEPVIPTPVYQSKTVTPSAIGETVVPDVGYDALSSVAVNGDFNLSAENIKKDVSIFGVTGTLDPHVEPNLQSKSVTPSASSQTVTPDTGYDGLSSVAVSGDGNLTSENIKKDVSIFGVTGNYEGSGGGGSSDYNVFVQQAEPTKKDGVWIKSSGSSNPTVYFAQNMTSKGDFVDYTDYSYLSYNGRIIAQVIVGDYLYSFAINYSNSTGYNSYKYNLKTREREQLSFTGEIDSKM